MKKMFALLLVLALLIPLGLVPVANAEGEVAVEPFYTLGWSDFDNEKYPYLEGLVTTGFSNVGDKARITYNSATITYGTYTDAQVTKFAEAMKKTMNALPEGLRYWKVFGTSKVLKINPENVIYMDHGVDQMKDMLTAILKKYKEIGGLLDGLVLDTEYSAVSSYYISHDTDINDNNAKKNPMVYKQIVEDPRYATEIRPLLEERGFKFYEHVTDYTPEIYGICGDAGSKYSNCAGIWDTVIRNHMNRYIDEYAYAPLKEYFPEASLSDYQSHDSYAWLKLAAVTDDGTELSGGNSNRAGSASCFSFYYARPSDSFYENLQKYASYNDALYAATAFNTLLYDINFAKHMYVSTDTKQIAPWITSYIYNSDKKGTIANTPYYSELLFHLGMLDPEPFLSFTYRLEYSTTEFALAQQIQNELMAELTRVAGYSDRKPVEMPPYWNSDFVLSGMYANGRNIWRITPNTDVVSVADFKVEGTDPTFCVAGQTVTFPGGKIIETADISTAGSCGYWVETAKDVNPIVTNDADRYQKYPSLFYDFENVNEGKFDYNSANPDGAWEFTWKKGSASTIQTEGDNKVLAINGTTEVRSVKLPGNVTAGDTYAEDQAWELTVTIPEGLSAEAEIKLLSYAGTQQKTDDGGFKIAGGKVYYFDNGEYKELMDISAGTYTFKRVLDFNDEAAFAGTYYVYDAAGKKLKSTQKVALPVFTTITSINFATTNADKDVLVDNFKLSVTGKAADFSLYDVATGMNVTADTPRAASTAYRLSWLNATGTAETATVIAAIYEGETLKEERVIKEVQMLPGCDGVESGIVEIAEGQSVKVYLETTDNGNKASKDGGNIGLIALITVGIVSVIAIVVALVATKPKKKTDTPAEQTKEEPEAEE